eukprot:224337-Chlamydomonas_euryale.AAC.8
MCGGCVTFCMTEAHPQPAERIISRPWQQQASRRGPLRKWTRSHPSPTAKVMRNDVVWREARMHKATWCEGFEVWREVQGVAGSAHAQGDVV